LSRAEWSGRRRTRDERTKDREDERTDGVHYELNGHHAAMTESALTVLLRSERTLSADDAQGRAVVGSVTTHRPKWHYFQYILFHSLFRIFFFFAFVSLICFISSKYSCFQKTFFLEFYERIFFRYRDDLNLTDSRESHHWTYFN